MVLRIIYKEKIHPSAELFLPVYMLGKEVIDCRYMNSVGDWFPITIDAANFAHPQGDFSLRTKNPPPNLVSVLPVLFFHGGCDGLPAQHARLWIVGHGNPKKYFLCAHF